MIGGFAAMGFCSAGITLALILQVCLFALCALFVCVPVCACVCYTSAWSCNLTFFSKGQFSFPNCPILTFFTAPAISSRYTRYSLASGRDAKSGGGQGSRLAPRLSLV